MSTSLPPEPQLARVSVPRCKHAAPAGGLSFGQSSAAAAPAFGGFGASAPAAGGFNFASTPAASSAGGFSFAPGGFGQASSASAGFGFGQPSSGLHAPQLQHQLYACLRLQDCSLPAAHVQVPLGQPAHLDSGPPAHRPLAPARRRPASLPQPAPLPQPARRAFPASALGRALLQPRLRPRPACLASLQPARALPCLGPRLQQQQQPLLEGGSTLAALEGPRVVPLQRQPRPARRLRLPWRSGRVRPPAAWLQ